MFTKRAGRQTAAPEFPELKPEEVGITWIGEDAMLLVLAAFYAGLALLLSWSLSRRRARAMTRQVAS